jgi:hypothetical protein
MATIEVIPSNRRPSAMDPGLKMGLGAIIPISAILLIFWVANRSRK